ncbi:P-loop containing nucleoside triphosphate hydrolase protein [Boletus reticuloceps]|uniref:P-loop containing nucleoside triphosphate hydrolase protein n=1 Tax=Boletus reticuloceps TaxID=495285 RepID=A0A8I2YDS1_9AGAM|nr:P-loop containing nucleoside triphosphate hydrolase protein [Boletus reticuloceps]
MPTTHEASLSVISDNVIITCLCKRFMPILVPLPLLLSTLTQTHSSKNMPHTIGIRPRTRTPFHPTSSSLVNNAYYHMRHTTQDQSLIISGETGSGKSETRRLVIKTLPELSVSNPGKKGSKLATQVPAAEFVVESFGNARTLFNPNPSRFGKYRELQFTNKGRLCGTFIFSTI